MEAPGQPLVVELREAQPTLEYHKIKGDKTYVEVAWLWRPLGNCPALNLAFYKVNIDHLSLSF